MNDIILSQIPVDELRNMISETVRAEVDRINANPPKPEIVFITRAETSKILGVSLPTLNDWSKRGIIPSYRIGTRVRYKKEEVLNSLNRVKTLKYGRY